MPLRSEDPQFNANIGHVLSLALGVVIGFLIAFLSVTPAQMNNLNSVGALLLFCDGQLPCQQLNAHDNARMAKLRDAAMNRY